MKVLKSTCSGVQQFAKNALINVKKNILMIFYSVLTLFMPIDNKKIIVDNFLGRGYGDDPKFIVDELLKRNCDYKIIWVVNNTHKANVNGIKFVKYGSAKSLRHFCTAKLWISNVRNTYKPRRKKGQLYLQIWHGTNGVKKVEKQVESSLSKDYINEAKKDGKDITHFLVDSKYQEEIYSKYFYLNDKVEFLRFGSLRADYIIHNQNNSLIKDKICAKYSISKNSTFILYAPTFRDNHSTNGFILNFNKILDHINVERPIVLFRLHPNDRQNIKNVVFSERIINVFDYPNLQDLSLASNYIITDYSSTCYDGLLQKKPVLIYEKDIEEYAKQREISDIYYKMPFPKCKNEKELINLFNNFNNIEYQEKLKEYNKTFITYDLGETIKKTCDWITNIIGT